MRERTVKVDRHDLSPLLGAEVHARRGLLDSGVSDLRTTTGGEGQRELVRAKRGITRAVLLSPPS